MARTLTLLLFAAVSWGCTIKGPSQRQPPAASALEAQQGEVTVAAFWATWCGPCRAELPKLEALHQKLKGDASVRVLAISIDRKGKAEEAKALAAKLGATMPLLTEGEPLYYRFFPKSTDTDVPRLAVFDRQLRGFETIGLEPNQSSEEFVAAVEKAVLAVKGGGAPPPGPWQPLKPAAK